MYENLPMLGLLYGPDEMSRLFCVKQAMGKTHGRRSVHTT